ncbi:tellurite resistance TerB family protein [Hymenobacter sp. BT664]|uniref:Tellurite resistance TerB family protein n=1 Tax=Hymenobacter montanus TaxID=2771359 RepID=A0A927BHL5_9BACT|nr:tellurite resistance TerB family protein [Hymenobacter montanus]MBD2770053.1 tellurite resistance TerB family protein [Hymenobacter montanus]
MGLFDKVFSSNAVQTNPFTDPREAFFAVLYACMSVDGNVADEEINALVVLTQQKALFRGVNVVEMYRRIVPKVIALGARKEIITLAAPHVPADLRLTLFANCVDFAASDGVVGAAEQAILEQIAQALALSEQESQNILEVILIKNRG